MKLYKVFTMTMATFSAISCYAQFESSQSFEQVTDKRIYMKIYGAYGLITPGSFKGISSNDNNEVNVVKVQRLGMGGGIRAGVGFGFIINEFVNVGVDGEYLKGKKIKVSVNALDGASGIVKNVTTQGVTTFEHEVLSFIPNIVFKAISKPTYYIYNRIGIIIGIPLSITENEESHYQYIDRLATGTDLAQRNIDMSFRGEHKVKTSIGYHGALGIQTRISENLRGFVEVAVYGISFDRIRYIDTERKTITTDKRGGGERRVEDNTRYNKEYKKTGATGYSYPASPPPAFTNLPERMREGTPNNYIYTFTFPQAPMNMNAITLGVGLAYRF